MKKTLYLGLFSGLLLIGASMSCNFLFSRTQQPKTDTLVPTTSPTETQTSTPTLVPLPTATPESTPTRLATATPKFAPFCEPSSASVATPIQCQQPIAQQSSVFCSNKVPYNLILINEGSTYETLNENVECADAGRKDGKQILTCTGAFAVPFELEVCDPACALPIFQTESTHCPEDYHFNDHFRCCEQKPHPIDSNCMVLKLRTKSCVIDCSEYNNQTTCDKNAYACMWDVERKVCLLKK